MVQVYSRSTVLVGVCIGKCRLQSSKYFICASLSGYKTTLVTSYLCLGGSECDEVYYTATGLR